MSENSIKYPQGIRVFKANENAPNFVKGQMVISLNELIKFCKENPSILSDYKGEKQLKLDILESKNGNGLNVVINTFKPKEKQEAPASVAKASTEDDLPF